METEVSLIIVHYQAVKELFSCVESILKSKPKTASEIIVVDNDKKNTLKAEINEKFPGISYVTASRNLGYAGGNNLGFRYAKGKYLFFLNPDTRFVNNCIDILWETFQKHQHIGIVAPQLLDETGDVLSDQCTLELTPLRGIYAHSIINAMFPNNRISREFWIKDWDRLSTREVAAVQGSAFMIDSRIFRKLNGFDENYFLYFDETDLCLRAKKLGTNILFEPKAKVIHLRERSTHNKKLAKEIYAKSRSYYFRKNFGIIQGTAVNAIFWLFDRWKIIIILILIVSTFIFS